MIHSTIALEGLVKDALKTWHDSLNEGWAFSYYIGDTMPTDRGRNTDRSQMDVEIICIDAGAGQLVRGTLNILYYFYDRAVVGTPEMEKIELVATRGEACAEALTDAIPHFIFALKKTPHTERLRDVGKTVLIHEYDFAYSNLTEHL